MISKGGSKVSCVLCQSSVEAHHQIQKDDTYFCCKGCQVVYNILQAQGALANFQDSPIYQQALRRGIITNPALHFPKGEQEQIPVEDFQKLHLTIQNM